MRKLYEWTAWCICKFLHTSQGRMNKMSNGSRDREWENCTEAFGYRNDNRYTRTCIAVKTNLPMAPARAATRRPSNGPRRMWRNYWASRAEAMPEDRVKTVFTSQRHATLDKPVVLTTLVVAGVIDISHVLAFSADKCNHFFWLHTHRENTIKEHLGGGTCTHAHTE